MESRGGGFLRKLAAAWFVADMQSNRKLFDAFGEYVDRYAATIEELMRPRFSIELGEFNIVSEIVKRAVRIWPGTDQGTLAMDIIAAHLNGCRLDLERLRNAPFNDFAHDIGGIQQFIDRKTGKIVGIFHPRCAA